MRVLDRFAPVLAAISIASPSVAQRPDLTVTDITAIGGLRRGTCNVIRATIRNQTTIGVSAGVPVRLRLEQGETSPTRTEVLRNGIGPMASLPVTFQSIDDTGLIEVIVDPDDLVAETTEKNNARLADIPAATEPCHTVTIADASAREGESLSFVLDRTGSSQDLQFDVTVAPVRPKLRTVATPIEGVCNVRTKTGELPDYYVPTRRVYFPPGVMRKTFSVLVCNDTIAEGSEQLTVTLPASSRALAVTRSPATGTFTDAK